MHDLLKTKTFWAGVVSIVSGIGLLFQGQAAEGMQLIATGAAAIFLRDAVRKGK